MKKLLSIALISILSITTAFAANDFIPFKTVEQAQQYCPATNALTFIPNIPTLETSGGAIIGKNRIAFESFPSKSAMRPKNMDPNHVILDAHFRSAEGMYGYISNEAVTCLYSYTSRIDTTYLLALRGK